MKLMKRAAVHIIPSQVRHCAVTPKIIINFGSNTKNHYQFCGPRGHFVRAAMLFGNCQIIRV